jgi:hypothetical protein
MGDGHQPYWIEPLPQRPGAPDTLDDRPGIDQCPVHIEQEASRRELPPAFKSHGAD